MKVTNKHGLHPVIYEAIRRTVKEYDNGGASYSVTDLLKPVQMVILTNRHYDNLSVDASDLIYSFWGTIGHHVLERAAKGNSGRAFITVNGRRISGELDYYDKGYNTIYDYKFCNVNTLEYQSKIDSWTWQLNYYWYLYKWNSAGDHFDADALKIMSIFRDWEFYKSLKDKAYPKFPFMEVNITKHEEGIIRDRLVQQVKTLTDNEGWNDVHLLECTSDEMWEFKGGYAVYPKAGKRTRALRVLDTLDDAAAWIVDNENRFNFELTVVKRTGRRTRCDKFCVARTVCRQYKDYCNASS